MYKTTSLLLLTGLLASQDAGKDGSFALASSEIGLVQRYTILVDDFAPQPLNTTAQACRDRRGKPFWCHNRLGGDRGEINPGSGSVEWGKGFVKAAIASGATTYAGVFTSLNHPIRDCEPINFSSIFPPQIEPQYQGRITGIRIHVRDSRGSFQVELQRGENQFCPPQISVWRSEKVSLRSGQDTLQFDLPSNLTEIQNLNWLVIGNAGDFAVVDRVELNAELPQLDPAQRAFLWSYAMLLANWDPESGLTRDHAYLTAGEYDNISASGMQAPAAVMAWHLGFITKASAIDIVTRTTAALMKLDRSCHGLWPHFVERGRIRQGTEWSSIDTIIALVALLEARQALGLETTELESVLTNIDWRDLRLENGSISHGYNEKDCKHIQTGSEKAIWKDFGTESWLVNLGYAAATNDTAVFDHTPPTYNGSGFIDELAWLLVPTPRQDRWGTPWCEYRQTAADKQLRYYQLQNHPCYQSLRLFGLSAAYVPDQSAVDFSKIYQAFGVGGEISPNDGADLLGHAAIVPHYAAMISSLRPTQAIALWEWLEKQGLFTPLNNAESFMFIDEPNCRQIVWNDRKDSWNLSLQTLGWGKCLAGNINPLYQALWANNTLRRGWEKLVCSDEPCAPVFCVDSIKTTVGDSRSVPRRFALLQNYPNPARLSSTVAKVITKIPIQLASASQVELSVFNLLGQKVATVFSGYLPEGKHEFAFDSSALPVGIYFCRLEVEGEVLYRKMIVR